MLEPAHERALRIVAAHGDDPLADILRQVADAFEVVGDPQHRDERAQVDGHRLPQRNGRDGFFFDLPLQCVDRRVGGDDLTRQTDVAPRQRVDRVRDLLLGETAHLRDHLRELDEVGIEDSGGVLGDVHDISAGAGDSIGVRTA